MINEEKIVNSEDEKLQTSNQEKVISLNSAYHIDDIQDLKFDTINSTVPEDFVTPTKEIFKKSVPSLNEIDIYVLECTRQKCIPIATYVDNFNRDRLVLSFSNIGPKDLRPLSTSLCQNKTITSLNLNHNWLGDNSISLLTQIFSDNQNFVELGLADNQFSSKQAEKLFDSLASAPNLVSLDLSENQFDDTSASFIADFLSTSSSLATLNLSRNKFSEHSTAHFGRGLTESETLKFLDISWNHICCAGKPMKQFCRGLGSSKVKKLNFSFNGIGPTVGCKELVLSLKKNSHLEELDLSDNRISPQGSVLLSKALTTNKHLKKIKFARNPFQSAGCFALLTGVLKNRASQLIELSFEDIIVNRDFKLLLDKAFNVLPNLHVIYGSKLIANDLKIYSLKLYVTVDTHPKKWLMALQNLQRMIDRPLFPFLNDADVDRDVKLSRYETTKALEVG